MAEAVRQKPRQKKKKKQRTHVEEPSLTEALKPEPLASTEHTSTDLRPECSETDIASHVPTDSDVVDRDVSSSDVQSERTLLPAEEAKIASQKDGDVTDEFPPVEVIKDAVDDTTGRSMSEAPGEEDGDIKGHEERTDADKLVDAKQERGGKTVSVTDIEQTEDKNQTVCEGEGVTAQETLPEGEEIGVYESKVHDGDAEENPSEYVQEMVTQGETTPGESGNIEDGKGIVTPHESSEESAVGESKLEVGNEVGDGIYEGGEQLSEQGSYLDHLEAPIDTLQPEENDSKGLLSNEGTSDISHEASKLSEPSFEGAYVTNTDPLRLDLGGATREKDTILSPVEEFEVLQPEPSSLEERPSVDPTAPDLLAGTVSYTSRSLSSEPLSMHSVWDSNSRFATLRSISSSSSRFDQHSHQERMITPMTEHELQYYYFNHMIQDEEQHVELFLKECRIERHHFYELVYNYYRARSNLLTVSKDVEKNQELYKKKSENCWLLKEENLAIKGVCADKLTVTGSVRSETAEFRPNIVKELEGTLMSIRQCIHETYALCAYTAQLSKLQIESYLHMLLQSSPVISGIESHMPCTSHMQLIGDPQMKHCIQEMKQCISVLFSFQRRPVVDTEFMESSRKWLERLVSYLLRVATFEDHFFLLNHLIRCPPGLESWAVSFLQLTFVQAGPSAPPERPPDWWGSPNLDHFVHMLAVLMSPAKSRDELLIRMKQAVTPDTPPCDALLNWTLLDEDGEEDERPSDLPLNECDLVALLTQFPFDELFKNVLMLPELGSASSQPVDAKHIMRLIAFSTTILKIFRQGLKTFNRSRYRQFVKRIGRLIRHTVQYVSAQWTRLRHSAEDIVEGYGPLNSMHMEQLSFARLQVEMDELFFRAVQCIMSSPRLGTWQFLADMPYTCLSGDMMWRLYWYLHSSFMGWADRTHVKDEAKPADYEWWLADFSNRNMFCKKLLDMPMSEVIYLLTTFANMATARGIEEEQFIKFVAKELYQITYVNKELREQLAKTGRELLYTVTTCHPFTLSHLLTELEQTVEGVGNMVLFLFSHLAFHLLRPTPQDFERLQSWLLHFGPDTIQSQVARLVLSKLNWGVDEESKMLVLDLHLHRSVAVLLVEAHCKHFADKNRAGYQGALQWNLSKFTYNIENFDMWAWDLVIKLRLHQKLQPYFDEQESLSMSAEGETNWSIPNVATDTTLYPVQKGLMENVPLACYVAVAMTETGHKLDTFLSQGLHCLQVLATTGYQRLCIPLLAIIVPMFMEEGHPDYLISNDSFISNVRCILSADFQNARFSQRIMGTVPGETTKLFANMIVCMLQERTSSSKDGRSSSMSDRPSPSSMLEFWLAILMTNPAWSTDEDHCYVLDQMLKVAFCQIREGMAIAVEAILQQYKTTKPEPRQGFLSTVLSFASSGVQMTSFLTGSNCKYTWLAYTILLAETNFLESREVMKGLIHEMQRNVDMAPETALKKACSKIKLDFSVSPQNLPIYRWGQLALDTELNHPLMSVIWQRFFTCYLQRYFSTSDINRRTSLGMRFFQSMNNNSTLKKLKRHLSKIADYHHSAGMTTVCPQDDEDALSVSSPGATGGEEIMEQLHGPSTIQGEKASADKSTAKRAQALSEVLERDHHQKLVRLYQTFSFWLEEPLLHDPGLYLPALPEQYQAEKLQLLFNAEKEPWHEFINYDGLSLEITAQAISWLSHVKPSYHDQRQRSTTLREQNAAVPNIELQSDRPRPPPDIPSVKPPVPDTPYHLLTDHEALWDYLKPQFSTMKEFATSVSSRSSMHVALDLNYLELLPNLYYHDEEQKSVPLSCKPTCKGPSVVTIRYTIRKVSDITNRQLRENRAEYAQVTLASLAPPPPSICMAAVHMENIITQLIKNYRLDPDPENAFRQTGISLFYHMAGQFDEDTKHYPPTRQFLASSIEVLGEDFIKPNPHQAQPLLQTILDAPRLAGVLSPNFCPNKCLQQFVEMYRQVVVATKVDSQDLGFMLLSKFDVNKWLQEGQPDRSSCLDLVTHIGEALRSCGKDDAVTSSLQHFEIYRQHFQQMLLHRFPSHFDPVLRILLDGTSNQELHTSVWMDTLLSLGIQCLSMKGEVSDSEIMKLVSPTQKLSLQQLRETVSTFGVYFSSSRQQNPASFQFGLYSQWSYCIGPIVSFLGAASLNFATQETERIVELDIGQQQVILNLWSSLCALYSPWIRPMESLSGAHDQQQLFPPWCSGDGVPASCMVRMFVQCISNTHQIISERLSPSSSGLLNMTWDYYANELAKVAVPGDILDVYHKALATLPWQDFSPNLTNMRSMVESYEKGSDLCLMFLAEVFQQVSWRDVLDVWCRRSDPEGQQVANQMVSYLLNLLIIFANQMSLTQTEGRNLMQLFEEAEEFPWSCLQDSSYQEAVTRLLQESNPACVFQQQSYNLRLMRAVAGMGPKSPPGDFSLRKHQSYINMVVGLLCKCSERKDVRQNDFMQPVQQLLRDVQVFASRSGDSVQVNAEVVQLLSLILALLNNCSPVYGVPHTILKAVQSWLFSCTDSNMALQVVTAACRSIASTKFMASIVELGLEAHFKSDNFAQPGDSSYGWAAVLAVLQIPEISHDAFVAECKGINAFLTLFAYITQQLPLCRSPDDEYALLSKLTSWSAACKVTLSSEHRIFLWCHKAFEMGIRLIHFGVPPWKISEVFNMFAKLMAQLGEDRTSTGLLGAIGLGSKSGLSFKFRLAARCIAAFVFAQLPQDGALRMNAHDPGAVNDHVHSPPNHNIPRPSSNAKDALKSLDSAIHSKGYASVKAYAQSIKLIILDPSKCMTDSPSLVTKLVTDLFPEPHCLQLLRQT